MNYDIELEDGTEFHFDDGRDGLWRIRSCHAATRIVGAVDLGRLRSLPAGVVERTFSGASLVGGNALPLPEGWAERRFHSAQEAELFVRRNWGRRQGG